MKHNQYNVDFEFIREPEPFDKYSDRAFLSYCLGGTLYMPAIRQFSEIVIDKTITGLTSMVVCFEDSIDLADLQQGEDNAIHNIREIMVAIESGVIHKSDVPLIFFRVRSVKQFYGIAEKLEMDVLRCITGFVFPKFSSQNGEAYFSYLKQLNDKHGEILYGMPILESMEIALKETRYEELVNIKRIIDSYKALTLNIRVGATDFSSCFGVRRGIDYSIYDILTVRDCLMDILNVFSRGNEYVISGPVWEYFLVNKDTKFKKNLEFSWQSSLLRRKRLINEAIDGLLREVILDKANGFIGKTVIHPTHIKYVNAMQAVTEEEYEDVLQILNTSGGVRKSPSENKMNEINPHRSWAEKMYYKARAYGVIKDETDYLTMISNEDFQ